MTDPRASTPGAVLPRSSESAPGLRRRTKVGLCGLVLLAGLGSFFAFTLMRPVGVRAEARYDAVVVLAGGNGERLDAGLELVDDGVASELVVSNGVSETWFAAGRICALERSIEVMCPVPDPSDTKGEIQMVSNLAEDHDWDQVLIVTSSYHRSRVARLAGRCGTTSIDAAGIAPTISPPAWIGRLLHEVGGHLATTFDRSCA